MFFNSFKLLLAVLQFTPLLFAPQKPQSEEIHAALPAKYIQIEIPVSMFDNKILTQIIHLSKEPPCRIVSHRKPVWLWEIKHLIGFFLLQQEFFNIQASNSHAGLQGFMAINPSSNTKALLRYWNILAGTELKAGSMYFRFTSMYSFPIHYFTFSINGDDLNVRKVSSST